MNLARRSSRETWRITSGRRYFSEVFMPGLYRGSIAPDGRVGLSWRTQLLEGLGEAELAKRVNRKEPWDGSANKALLDAMPDVFASPGRPAPPGHTYIRAFAGPHAMIPGPRPGS